jgi:hypothetical protein
VVIYELDTPVVSTSVASDSVDTGGSQSLTALFSATDPAGKAITSWQVYDTNAGGRFSLHGSLSSDHSAATALTVRSLAGLDLLAGQRGPTRSRSARSTAATGGIGSRLRYRWWRMPHRYRRVRGWKTRWQTRAG